MYGIIYWRSVWDMLNEELLHIYLEIVVEQKGIEIEVSETASFHSILTALYTMKQIPAFEEDVCIFEKESMLCCDTDVALYSLNVQNGMVFQVY